MGNLIIPEEDLLLNSMLKGNEVRIALNILYNRHAQSLFEFIYLLIRKDQEMAKDIVQETFLRIYEKRHWFDPSKPFRPWLFRIAINLCKNEFRRIEILKRNQPEIAEIHSETPCSFNPDEVDRIWEEVDRLAFDHQQVIILRYRSGLQVGEIAEILECPEGTVKSRLFYAVKILSGKIKIDSFENY